MKKCFAWLLLFALLFTCSLACASSADNELINPFAFITNDGRLSLEFHYPASLKVCAAGYHELQLDLNNGTTSDVCFALYLDLDSELPTDPEELVLARQSLAQQLKEWVESDAIGGKAEEVEYWDDEYHTILLSYNVAEGALIGPDFSGEYPAAAIVKILDLPIGNRMFYGMVFCPEAIYADSVALLNQMLESGKYLQ